MSGTRSSGGSHARHVSVSHHCGWAVSKQVSLFSSPFLPLKSMPAKRALTYGSRTPLSSVAGYAEIQQQLSREAERSNSLPGRAPCRDAILAQKPGASSAWAIAASAVFELRADGAHGRPWEVR
eukprot:2293144-Prymnesium_polylepis.1